MWVVRPILVMVLLLGIALVLLAVVGLMLSGVWKIARALPTDSTTTSAWIGFAGSIVGALLTIVAGSIALYPAYRQMQEAGRASAVQTGQILRVRYKAAKDEMNIILKRTYAEDVPKLLALAPDDTSREKWAQNHPDTVHQIREVILPRMEEIGYDLFQANWGIDLPDLDRAPYWTGLGHLKMDLYSVLDGIPRAENGTPGPVMSPEQWKAHVAETIRVATDEWPQAHLDYNNKINAAITLLKYQILQADRAAVGDEAYEQFRRGQKEIGELEKRP